MPEIHFQIQWPDGIEETCYSPSLVVCDYFAAENDYPLDEFVERSQIALKTASDRVLAKYGMPCSRALGQLGHIEAMATKYNDLPTPKVRFIKFVS